MSGRLTFRGGCKFHFYMVASLAWIIGLSAGVLTVLLSARCLIAPYQLTNSNPTFFGLFLSSALPVICVSFVAITRHAWLLFLIVFSKAFLHGYCTSAVFVSVEGVIGTFHGAYLFSQSCCCILMMFSCFYLYQVSSFHRRIYTASIILAAFFICLIDYYFFSV